MVRGDVWHARLWLRAHACLAVLLGMPTPVPPCMMLQGTAVYSFAGVAAWLVCC